MSTERSNMRSETGLTATPGRLEAVLSVVEGMRSELHGTAGLQPVTPSSHLEQDVGLDSLSRMELLARIEAATGASLDEQAVMRAETVGELCQAMRAPLTASPESDDEQPRSRSAPSIVAPGSFTGAPLDEATLLAALDWHLREHPQRIHLTLVEEHGQSRDISYGALFEGASAIARGLVARDVEAGDAVAIMLPTDESYLQSFLACMLVGAVPVPIYPPARAKQLEQHFERHARILDNAQVRMLITFEQALTVSHLLGAPVPTLTRVVTPQQLRDAPPVPLAHRPSAGDTAFLQYTSGSTGDPKGVVLTHANLMASLRSMARAMDAGPSDVFVSWLPLYHDMGLIGAWFGALVVGFPLVLMSPLSFLARPQRWLEAISRYGGTISGGPNFAYELCVRRIDDQALEDLDLSCWRAAFNGAEPVSARTMREFVGRFQVCGLDARAMTPVYGLAEATLGVAFTPPGRGPRVERVMREALYHRGQVRLAPARAGDVDEEAPDADLVECVSSGVPIPGFEVRIVSAAGVELPERAEGAVEFRGPGATPGYFRNPAASRGLKDGDWTATGDRGFTLDGELFITGRDKDVVIRAGRNLYPYALEQAVADVAGVRRGCVAVFASTDPVHATEALVVLAETRETDPERRAHIVRTIDELSLEHLGLPADQVVLAPPHTVLKTSSGKIRRSALAASYADGSLARSTERAMWMQLVRLVAGAVLPWARTAVARARAHLYSGWCLLVLAVTVAVVWPSVVVSSTPATAWRRARRGVRALFRLCSVRVQVEGENMLVQGGSILVSNHQSYLDGLVLVLALKRPVRFVAKRELTESFFAHHFLRALDVLFVDRFDRAQAVLDADAVVRAVEEGAAVLFFAEGTFHRMAGLLPFQLGAFETALRAGVPVQPLVIRGSRHVLRGDDHTPNPGLVRVRVLEASNVEAVPSSRRWSRALELRRSVRGRMLQHCDEPDLAAHGLRTRLDDSEAEDT